MIAGAEKKPARRRTGLDARIARKGWMFILPAFALILLVSFYPMIQSLLLSLQKGKGNNLTYAGLYNYQRLFKDKTFISALSNTFTYLIVQVPIMLLLALALATMLNDKTLKCKGLLRTLIFMPCATSLISAATVARQLFAANGLVNTLLLGLGWIAEPLPFFTEASWTRGMIILVMLWRWTGYNMIFYLAGLQNIDSQVYEAARIDGASVMQQFGHITIPLLRPVILMTTIISTNGTLQLFDEARILANTANMSDKAGTISTYIYRMTFENVPQFGYASAMGYVIFILVAILALIQLKVGDQK